ncbi:unnamed protein product [Darwinula stevensoni]|uniref:Peptidase S1 domain-containing protein n=1 Tax=Darwinula stevensoni TaxID=69355 RepID=A0A7R8XF40_9CRUS|nr:unnamed protein product [Darwinula stevensoni]CAG0895116.1 unnamed protein product [Darwinula stevensoni]
MPRFSASYVWIRHPADRSQMRTPEVVSFRLLSIYESSHKGGRASSVLQKVSVPLVGPSDCDQVPRKYKGLRTMCQNGVKGRILCAGTGGNDSCQGNSVGPLMLSPSPDSCVHTIVGIASTGVGCGNPDFPGFYTQVSSC